MTPNYPSRIPTEIPDGYALVHNHVRPARQQGTRGFRFWLGEPGDHLVPCECGWAPELGEHYRVNQDERSMR